MTLCQNCRYKKAGMRAYNNLPQPNPYILVFEGCGRLLHALNPPHSAFLFQQFQKFLAWCHPYILLHVKSEVGYVGMVLSYKPLVQGRDDSR